MRVPLNAFMSRSPYPDARLLVFSVGANLKSSVP